MYVWGKERKGQTANRNENQIKNLYRRRSGELRETRPRCRNSESAAKDFPPGAARDLRTCQISTVWSAVVGYWVLDRVNAEQSCGHVAVGSTGNSGFGGPLGQFMQ